MEDTTIGSPDFARAFGDALGKFLKANGISQIAAANQLGLGKARLNTYFHDSRKGKRPEPSAEVLYLVCAGLGFEFDYRGYRIGAATLNGHGLKPAVKQPGQLEFEYDRQFHLTDQRGTVSVSVKRPPGRVEVSVSLKAVS
jgi:transcriptional regulator with XRE-family HTH domain